jgi:mycofactocin precursor
VDVQEREPEDRKDEAADSPDPDIIEEIEIEDLAVDGICGVY